MTKGFQGLSGNVVTSDGCQYSISNQWFAIRSSMVFDGCLQSMTNPELRVYLAIKAHLHVHSGEAFPSLKRLAEMAGISLSQVQRGVKSLEVSGHVVKRRVGRKNYYTIMEQELVRNQNSQVTHVATWTWKPNKQKLIHDELKQIRTTGANGEFRYVSVKKFQAATSSESAVPMPHSKIPDAQELMQQLEATPTEANRILMQLRNAISAKVGA